MKKRIIAGALSAILIFSNVSVNVFATSQNDSVSQNQVISEATAENQEETENSSVSQNETGTEELSVSQNEIETEEVLEGQAADTSVSENEIEVQAVSEQEMTAGLLRSTTESYLMDISSPYDGNYLLVANTNTDSSAGAESSGTFPVATTAGVTFSEKGENDLYGEITGDIYAYDTWGRGLIDPASFLPELKLDSSASDCPTPLMTTVVSETAYAVGDTRTFYLDNDSTDGYNAVTCVCTAIGTHSTVWVPSDDPIYVNNADLMRSYMATLAAEFDKQYSKMTEMFGDTSALDASYGDGDGKTALVCYDIAGDGNDNILSYTAGYYFGADTSFPFSNATGNDCDLLHIDSWHGMKRDTENQLLTDPIASRGTIVHELQHMINFAVNRANDPAIYSLKTPDYINEAFSMAAEHLCYGSDECKDRVRYYNQYSGIANGDVSLLDWNGYDTLSSYALSYLFGQYIRTQYKNGDTIYRDAMNEFDSSSKNLLSIIAGLLNVTEKELLLNFRAALFQKNAEGPYGFKGEQWAESILQQPVTTEKIGTSKNLDPGAAVVVPMQDTYTPSEAGENISFAGMYLDLTDEDVKVTVSGDTSITQEGGTLQLSASVYPKGVSQSVIFTIPNEDEKAYAMVTTDGLVTAMANGRVTVRATSVYNPEKYDEITIALSGQNRVGMKKTEEILDEGYRVQYTATEPTNAKLYYTYSFLEPYPNGNLQEGDPNDLADPTAESTPFPTEGLEFTEVGTHVIKVIGIADGYISNILTATYQVEELVMPLISSVKNEDGTYTVSIQAQDGAQIAYTLDGSDPVRPATEETLYTGPFQVTTPGWVYINAIAYKPGMVTSAIGYKCLEVPVATPQIAIENVLGGKEVSLTTSTEDAKIYYTLDGSEPSEASILYTDTLTFDKEMESTIKAIAVVDKSQVSNLEEEDEYSTSSEVASETITVGKTKAVISSQPNSILVKGDIVSLYSETANAYIYYTLDGTNPSESGTSTLYNNYLTMGDEVLRICAYARSYGNEDSEIVNFVYAQEGMITDIILKPENVTLYANMEEQRNYQLNVSVQPEGIEPGELQWESSNTEVVKVDNTGKLTAIGLGSATITVSSEKIRDTCTVTVKNAVESIELLNESLIINEDKGTLQLETIIYPTSASKDLTYRVEMSDRDGDAKGIARIDDNGVLTAIKSGVVKVTIEPKENLKNIPSVVAYVNISNQRSYSSTYCPKVSGSTITLNKKAVDGATVNIYSIGNESSVTSVEVEEDNRYAEYFDIVKEEESGTYEAVFTELGKKSLRNGTYRLPVVIEFAIIVDDISYMDTITSTLKIRVNNSVPRVLADTLKINRYSSKLQYNLTMQSAVEEFEILGLADADDTNIFTNHFTIESGEETKLILNQSINNIEEYKDRYSVKGYVRVRAAGYEEQLVPLTIYIQNTVPAIMVDGGKKLLNYQILKEEPATKVSLSESINRMNSVSISDIQNVVLDESSRYYEAALEAMDSLAADADSITISWNINAVKTKTYYIPLLVTTQEYVNVPVTVEVAVQKENVMPKVKLDNTILMLNRNYPDETASTGIRSISQTNVILTDFEITPYEKTLFTNKDTAVSLKYEDGKLVAFIKEGEQPSGLTYMFTCIPQYADGIVSDQEITVTVKIHEKQAAVSLTGNGSIDVLRRDETAVVYTVNKINFTDRISEVKLITPEKTSSSVYDGSDAITFSYDAEKGTITVKAKDDYKFIKGKKYAFRFAILKENGLNGDTSEMARTLLSNDLSIKPIQSSVRFTVDRVPSLFRYVSVENNTQTVNLRSNMGTIEAVCVKAEYPLPEGITIHGTNTFETIRYDGIGYYEMEPGYYICRLNVYMKGQMYKEVNGELVQEPISCQVRYRIY